MDAKPKVKLARKLRRQMSPPEVRLWVRLANTQSEHLSSTSIVPRRTSLSKSMALSIPWTKPWPMTKKRDAWLLEKGIVTLRIPAIYIMQDADSEAEGVIEVIQERIAALKLAM